MDGKMSVCGCVWMGGGVCMGVMEMWNEVGQRQTESGLEFGGEREIMHGGFLAHPLRSIFTSFLSCCKSSFNLLLLLV